MSFVLPPNTKKILFAKSVNKEKVTQQKTHYGSEYHTEIKTNSLTHYDNYNAYIYDINKQYFVIDIDSEHAFNFVFELLKKHDYKNVPATKSISNYKKVNDFKHHLYLNNNLKIQKDTRICRCV